MHASFFREHHLTVLVNGSKKNLVNERTVFVTQQQSLSVGFVNTQTEVSGVVENLHKAVAMDTKHYASTFPATMILAYLAGI